MERQRSRSRERDKTRKRDDKSERSERQRSRSRERDKTRKRDDKSERSERQRSRSRERSERERSRSRERSERQRSRSRERDKTRKRDDKSERSDKDNYEKKKYRVDENEKSSSSSSSNGVTGSHRKERQLEEEKNKNNNNNDNNKWNRGDDNRSTNNSTSKYKESSLSSSSAAYTEESSLTVANTRRSSGEDVNKRNSNSDSNRQDSYRHRSGREEKKVLKFVTDLDDNYFDELKKKNEDDEVFDDQALAEIDGFLESEVGEDSEEARLAKLEEERRLRREAIMKKYNDNNSNNNSEGASSSVSGSDTSSAGLLLSTSSGVTAEQTPKVTSQEQVIQNDNDKDDVVTRSSASGGDLAMDISVTDLAQEEEALAQEERAQQHSKIFDIFSSSPTLLEMTATGRQDSTGGIAKRYVNKNALLEGDDPMLESNWDDGEGYYTTRVGEVVCDRYRVIGEVGKGVFSTAIKCIDVKKHDSLVVLKIIRNNNIMRKASEKELFLLQLIAQTDPLNKKHCVKLLGNTEYRSHVVLVFEALGMNLRETVKKFGKHVGINVTAVRLYARQLFVALRHLAELKIVHADIKPDNILVSEDLKQVKICDFGSAFRETDTDNDPTPYLQSRFYRAPEIILGLSYDRMIDLWSVGACLYELFTGHLMFPGRTNNEMIRLHQEYKGKVPNRLIKAHQRSFELLELDSHFDSDLKFKMHEIDTVTKKPIMRLVDINAPKKSISSILLQAKAGADDREMVLKVADVLEKCLTLDPSKRVTVAEILKHPLFTEK